MSTNNPLSLEEIKKTISYGFYYPLLNEQKQKRQEVLVEYNRRITQLTPQIYQVPGLEQSLQLGLSDWRLFNGIVSKVQHLTQPNGEDDYCVLSYDDKSGFLYLAREIFSGPLTIEDLSSFLFSQLTGPKLANNEKNRLLGQSYQRQADFTQKLLRSRAVPYQLTDLLEALLNGITDEKLHEFRGETMDQERTQTHEKYIQEALSKFMSKKPRNLRDFTSYLEQLASKGKPLSMYDLTDRLGELGILNAKAHILLRSMRGNLLEGDIEELQYNYLDFLIISKCSSDGRFYDEWVGIEAREFMRDYQEFLAQTRQYIKQSLEEFGTAVKTENIQEARQLTEALTSLKEYFSISTDPDTLDLAKELNSAIEKMSSSNP